MNKANDELINPVRGTTEIRKAYTNLRSLNITWISIAGSKGSGKDTYAAEFEKILAEYNTEGLTIMYRWALPMKEYCHQMFGWSLEDLEEFDFKESVCPRWGFTPRKALQLIGQDFLKKLNPHFILDYAAQALSEAIWDEMGYGVNMRLDGLTDMPTPKEVFIIIPDTRFESEINWLQSMVDSCDTHALVSFRVHRGGVSDEDTHVSEQPLPSSLIDTSIYNNGLLCDVPNHARHLIQQHVMGDDQELERLTLEADITKLLNKETPLKKLSAVKAILEEGLEDNWREVSYGTGRLRTRTEDGVLLQSTDGHNWTVTPPNES